MPIRPLILGAAAHDTAASFDDLFTIYLVVTTAVGGLLALAILVACLRRRGASGASAGTDDAPRVELAYVVVLAGGCGGTGTAWHRRV
ncbi:MAG: hypothetical protein ACHQEA_06030 [Gaiellales bacterium]